MQKSSVGYVYLYSFIIAFIITFIVWHGLLNQVFLAEGANYLIEPFSTQIFKSGIWEVFKRYDVFAILFFRAFGDIAKDNMRFYMWFMLVGISFVNWGVFILVYKVTRSFLAGILSLLVFVFSYIGSFEILGIGVYPYFIQRVPEFFFALLSLMFLNKYFTEAKTKFYVISFLLYALAFFLAHYTLLILPLFLCYSVLNYLFENPKRYKNWIKGIIIFLPFGVWSLFLFSVEPKILVMDESFFHFVLFRKTIWMEALTKLTLLTIPVNIITFLQKLVHMKMLTEILAPWVGIFYLFSLFFLMGRAKRLRSFILSLFFSIGASLLMALYLRPYIVYEFGSSRYLYVTAIFVSMFWGIFLYVLISLKINIIYRIFSIILFSVFLYLNYNLIQNSFFENQDKHDQVSATVVYLRKNHESFTAGTLVVLPKYNSSVHAQMFDRFYGQGGIYFISVYQDLDKALEQNDKVRKIIRLDYVSGEIETTPI